MPLTQLPRQIRMTHEKELQKYCGQLPWLPLSLGGTLFDSVHHLKQHIADLVDRAEAGKLLEPSSAAEKVVMALLDYHPNAFMKKGGSNKDFVGIKVDLHEKANKAGERTKGVFVVRKHQRTQEEDVEVSRISDIYVTERPFHVLQLKSLFKAAHYESQVGVWPFPNYRL